MPGRGLEKYPLIIGAMEEKKHEPRMILRSDMTSVLTQRAGVYDAILTLIYLWNSYEFMRKHMASFCAETYETREQEGGGGWRGEMETERGIEKKRRGEGDG